jgi:hypothetical protein
MPWLGLSWPDLPSALSSRILYLGTSSSRIALASFPVTCMSDLGSGLRTPVIAHLLDHWRYWASRTTLRPGGRQLHFASARLHDTALCVYLAVLRSVWRFPTGTQVRGSTVKKRSSGDHDASMGVSHPKQLLRKNRFECPVCLCPLYD